MNSQVHSRKSEYKNHSRDYENLLMEIKNLNETCHNGKLENLLKDPSQEYERSRKRLRSGIQNLWYYSENILEELQKKYIDEKELNNLQNYLHEHKS